MRASTVILATALVLVVVVVAAAGDYTHSRSSADDAKARVTSDYRRELAAVAAERGKRLARECGAAPPPLQPVPPRQEACARAVLASLPVPSPPDRAAAAAAAMDGWESRRVWYGVGAFAIAVVGAVLAFVAHDRRRERPRDG